MSEPYKVTVAGAIRRPRVDRLDAVGELMPEENNELTSGTVIDVGGVQVRLSREAYKGSRRPHSRKNRTSIQTIPRFDSGILQTIYSCLPMVWDLAGCL